MIAFGELFSMIRSLIQRALCHARKMQSLGSLKDEKSLTGRKVRLSFANSANERVLRVFGILSLLITVGSMSCA
jgi:hypothetical protein